MPWETRFLTTYDLVSHGESVTSECVGAWNESAQTGWGAGYQNNCIHSGNIKSSGDLATTWYNYTLASAGTIFAENTTEQNPANNTTRATESVCPKGWTLPSKTQLASIGNDRATYIPAFSPVFGGSFYSGTLYNENTRGFWWASEASSGGTRYRLGYNGSLLYSNIYGFHAGLYIRCVAKQKTITDLAYMQDVTDELTTYDLVSHGTNTEGQNECYGLWSETTGTGWGPAYQNSCIHSGATEHSGGDTVWYNYTIASAGTIIDENTSSSNPPANMNTTTESVCPKGWTLPTLKQMESNRTVSNFSPVYGGAYSNSILNNENTHGYWWSSEVSTVGAKRRLEIYNNNSLGSGSGARRSGIYIRCVSEEKTATDLTYMQDMTP